MLFVARVMPALQDVCVAKVSLGAPTIAQESLVLKAGVATLWGPAGFADGGVPGPSLGGACASGAAQPTCKEPENTIGLRENFSLPK